MWLAGIRVKGMGRFSHYDAQVQFSVVEAASLAAGLSPERLHKGGDSENETRYREYLRILCEAIDTRKLDAKTRRHAFLAGVRIDDERPETLDDICDEGGWITATTADGQVFNIALESDTKTTLIDRADLVAFFAAIDGGDCYFCATPAEAERSPINPNDPDYAPRLHMAWLTWEKRYVTMEWAAMHETDIRAEIEEAAPNLVGADCPVSSAARDISVTSQRRDALRK